VFHPFILIEERTVDLREAFMIDSNDPDTVTLAQRGDVQAVGRLYDQHHEALFRYIWVRVGENQLAEDMTGDVFMRMLDALPRFRPTDVPFRAWLYRIARNMIVDHFRKVKSHSVEPLQESHAEIDSEDNPALTVEQKLSSERLHQALESIDEVQREVVSLRFFAGLSLEETATALEKTEAAVKALQHRGLAALRQALSEGKVYL
jgi:RNA polymerase sigma-70 factor (ECF subfamily)